jgi:hypothetical protein
MSWLVLAGALSGCSTDRTVRESTYEGSWSPAELALFPGCSLSIENDATRERVTVEVAADGRVHAKLTGGGRTDAVDAASVEALKRDHPEIMNALRALRIDYRISTSFTTVART